MSKYLLQIYNTYLLIHALQELNLVNTLRLSQFGLHFPDDIFKCIYLNENV